MDCALIFFVYPDIFVITPQIAEQNIAVNVSVSLSDSSIGLLTHL